MNPPEIEVTPREVVVEGFRIPRPTRISAKQWLDFWEYARDYDEDYVEHRIQLLQLQRWARMANRPI